MNIAITMEYLKKARKATSKRGKEGRKESKGGGPIAVEIHVVTGQAIPIGQKLAKAKATPELMLALEISM